MAQCHKTINENLWSRCTDEMRIGGAFVLKCRSTKRKITLRNNKFVQNGSHSCFRTPSITIHSRMNAVRICVSKGSHIYFECCDSIDLARVNLFKYETSVLNYSILIAAIRRMSENVLCGTNSRVHNNNIVSMVVRVRPTFWNAVFVLCKIENVPVTSILRRF